MLWKKESEARDAMHVDLFAGNEWISNSSYNVPKLNGNAVKKDDTISTGKRNEGNVLFVHKDWRGAIRKYNESLCFAEHGSTNLGLAYANRSACFFHMNRFKECLIDIELAKMAGYPDHLMSKLDARNTKCLDECCKQNVNLMKPDGPQMRYEPDEKFPCLANVLKFAHDVDGDCAVFATEDIALGRIIAIETPCIVALKDDFEWNCSNCLKSNTNLMPCTKCTDAMFCSKACQEHYIHGYECGMQLFDDNDLNGQFKVIVRSIFYVIGLFSSIGELMNFIEQTMTRDLNEVPDTLADDKSKYRAYIKQLYKSNTVTNKDLLLTFIVCDSLSKHPMIKPQIRSERHRRFLMHLILMHFSLPVHQMQVQKVGQSNTMVLYSKARYLRKYFKYSCMPNAFWSTFEGRCSYITVRPVKKGEQIVIGMFDMLMEPKVKRQQAIFESLGYLCKCSRCNGIEAEPELRRQMAADRNYLEIMSISGGSQKEEKKPQLVGNCLEFLNKFGHADWCDEIGKVVIVFANILSGKIKRAP